MNENPNHPAQLLSDTGAIPQSLTAESSPYDSFPLSFAQQRLWFLDQLEPGSAAYNIRVALRLEGTLNLAALAASFDEIVRRHESLRTSFVLIEGQPVQVIRAQAAPLGPQLTDLSDLSKAEQIAQVQELASSEAQRPFKLAEGPLIRVRLLRLGEQEHVLLLTMHHIISDGWSMGILFRELSALYRGYSQGAKPELPELGVQYADYAVWQREYLSGAVLEEQLGYWKEQLRGAPAVMELPTDRARPAVQSYRGRRQRVRLSAGLTEQLQELSRREDVTLFMTLLAAFQVLLGRYSGQSEVVVGTPVANRNRGEIEGVIGFFLNTLALRTDLSGEPTFRELLARVKRTALGAYAHQDLPFELLLEELRPERALSHQPLVQVMLQWQPTPLNGLALLDLTASPLLIENETSKFDLTLLLAHTELGLVGSFEYNSDLFEESTIKRMMGHFENLLEAIVAAPGEAVTKLSLLGGAEREQLLQEWNETGTEYRAGCVHELFAEQVRRTPGAIALVSEEQQLSYQELEERANQVGGLLRERGLGAEALVGIVMERSVEMVVALLGVLKAGAAYVPLDPQYPEERLRYMIEDSGVRVVLTQEKLAAQVREYVAGGEVAVWALDGRESELSSGPAGPSRAAVSSSVGGENLAYVIYTSGSSGQPKGVAITHQGLNNLLCTMREAPGLSRQDVLLAVTTLSFDIAALELFLPLCVGGRLVLATQQTARDGLALQRQLQETGATVMQATPATWRLLIESGWQGRAGLRLFCGGEALSRELAQALLARGGELWNLFGPTETTIWSALERVASEAGAVMIGRPVANTEVYVLDSEQQAVPIGVVGELYIGGAGLARGYLNRAELTAERFVPAGVGAGAGRRLYRTGDQVRWRRDGRLEYLGRMDQQVKVRGHRIELGEIEQVLERAGGVKQSVVVVREDVAGEQRLVAYVVSGAGAPVAPEELRKQLRERLPEYMIPGAIVALAELPLTPNGKVDRRALPVPELGRADLPEPYQAPRTATELTLCRIWSEVLRIDQVGINDNFFALGGHSLMATQLVSRVRQTFQVELPTRSMFELPTVKSLSEQIEKELKAGQQQIAPAILPRERKTEPLLSFAQQRLWFLDQLEPGSAAYNIRVALRLEGTLNLAALAASFDEIVRRHESLRTSFVLIEGQPVQVIRAQAAPLGPQLTDLSDLSKAEQIAQVQELASSEAQRPFKLAEGPLIRVRLLRLGEQEHVLLLTMHHIISDGWSMGILFRELSALYRGYSQGAKPELPELGVQYADYAVWQREYLSGAVLEEQLGYWREQLRGAPAVLELPTDRARPAQMDKHWGSPHHLRLSPALTKRLKELSNREGVTLYMTLLAAFQLLLARYSGQEEIIVGAPIAGRNLVEIESLIGLFVNTLVLRTDLSGNPSFRTLLARVREVCLGAYARQNVPFEKLVEELQPERSRKYNPLFQVVFQLQNAPTEALSLTDLNVSPMMIEGGMVNLDLSLSIKEGAEGLNGTLRYNTDLFDSDTILRMLGHFQNLLEAIVAAPDEAVTKLSLLGGAEREQLLQEWNETGTEYRAGCVHELFAEQVRRTPGAIALVSEEQQLSYQELEERANQVAGLLRERGLGAEALVGIVMERSVEMVVALLGVLKAGAAYVPLDPQYPEERLRYMIEDSGVRVVLTQEKLAAQVREYVAGGEVAVWALDGRESELSSGPAGPSRAAVSSSVGGENLAYVIYTSGSTGSPKGVMTSHRALVNYTVVASNAYDLGPADRVLQFASLNFDTSAEEIFPCLVSGATLVLRTAAMLSSMKRFLQSCAETAITVLDLPTAFWHELSSQLAVDGLTIPAAIRLVIIGGEKALRERLHDWQKHVHSSTKIVNTYGPTEATIVTTMSELTSVPGAEQPEVPIGRPIANAKTYLLDRQLQPVPIGVNGELFISGDGLARGYLNRPDLTAERFIPNPFDDQSGTRLYRTGDLARYRSDGQIEFAGRTDAQVKVRGFRIELGEIEAALDQHPAVYQSLVSVREDTSGEKRLVAYLLVDKASRPATVGWREYLKEKLPEYMLPTAFVTLDSFPQTPNGKVDRRALPVPDSVRPELEKTFVEPRTFIETELAKIWSELLKVQRVGIHDNFFSLGGHSLLLTRLASRIRAKFQLDLSLQVLFGAPTILEMTKAIAQQQVAEADVDELALMLKDLKHLSVDEINVLLETEA